jgi:hypothetical protein
MQNESEKGENLIRTLRPRSALQFRIRHQLRRDVEFRTALPLTYFVPCVIGTLSSPSLAIMSSADVSGFTIFSM